MAIHTSQVYHSHSHNFSPDVLRDLWDPALFYSLLQCAQKTGNTTLALDLLTDIKALYGTLARPLDWVRVFEKMLSLVKSRKDLTDYLPVSAFVHVPPPLPGVNCLVITLR